MRWFCAALVAACVQKLLCCWSIIVILNNKNRKRSITLAFKSLFAIFVRMFVVNSDNFHAKIENQRKTRKQRLILFYWRCSVWWLIVTSNRKCAMINRNLCDFSSSSVLFAANNFSVRQYFYDGVAIMIRSQNDKNRNCVPNKYNWFAHFCFTEY